MLRILRGTIITALLAFAAPAFAVTILDTTQGSSNNTAWTVYDDGPGQYQAVALPFSWASSIVVTDITAYLDLWPNPGNTVGSVTLGVMGDASGVPNGSFLYSTLVPLAQNSVVSLSGLNWSIAGGTPYWLAALPTAGTEAEWQAHSSAVGTTAFDEGGGNWFALAENQPEAIISSNAASATPLPAAFPMFASGLGALGALFWRRRRMQTA